MAKKLSLSCPIIYYANENGKDKSKDRNSDYSAEVHWRHHRVIHGDCPEKATRVLRKRWLEVSRAKLKTSATTSQILCGFAMTAAAELQTNNPEDSTLPEGIWIAYLVCTTLLVCVHALAIMISTYVLPKLDIDKQLLGSSNKLKNFVEMAWLCSNLFGLFLFLIEILLLCWVKFWDFFVSAAIAGTIVVIPAMLIFIAFAAYSYYCHVDQKLDSSMNDVRQLETMQRDLDNFHFQ